MHPPPELSAAACETLGPAMLDLVSDLCVLADTDGTILHLNRAFIAFSGYEPEDLLGRKPFAFLNIPEDLRSYHEGFQRLLTGEAWTCQLVLRRKSGEAAPLEVRIHPLLDPITGHRLYAGICRDRSLQHQLEQRWMDTQKLEALSTLASGIAHRFNNLLANVLLQAELLAVDPRIALLGKGKLERIIAAIQTGKDIVGEITSFSARSPRVRREFDAAPVLRRTVQFMQSVSSRALHIECQIEDEPLPLHGSSDEINQLLIQLLTNAVQAVKPEDGHIRLSARRRPRPENETHPTAADMGLEIVVEDNGEGMSESVRARIFEPFFTTRSRAEASGMGLAIAHGVVQRHQGTINCTSVPGKGSRFTLWLPLNERTVPEPASHAQVLLVEDDAEIRRMGTESLTKLGYDITAFADLSSTLRGLEQSGTFDAAIVDHFLPDGTGIQLVRELRSRGCRAPVILSTGFEHDFNVDEIRALGIEHVLRKPCPMETIEGCLRRVLPRERP